METEDHQQMYVQASALEQESQEIENSLQFIDNQITELAQFKDSLNVLINTDENSTLSYLGKGVYIKTKIESKELYVEVGAGIVVKKKPEEAREVIIEQLKKFEDVRGNFISQLQSKNAQLSQLMSKLQ